MVDLVQQKRQYTDFVLSPAHQQGGVPKDFLAKKSFWTFWYQKDFLVLQAERPNDKKDLLFFPLIHWPKP
jgi:hypothetical protein